MKKFIATLFILLILGGAVFLCGWAQLTVPPGDYGVIRSKTHGLDPRPVQSGEFRWLWYKLIPTNVTITVFKLDPVSRSIHAGGTLPSGKLYAAFAGTGGDFAWELDGTLYFSISPGSLPSIVASKNIGTQEELLYHETELAGEIEAVILQRLSSDDQTGLPEELLDSSSGPQFNQTIQDRFPYVTNVSFMVKKAEFPDFVLYRQVKTLYEAFMQRQEETVSAALNQNAEAIARFRLRFEELERYGILLTKYPVLLDYLAIEGGK